MNNKKIAITLGDFNGIGPEIVVKALNKLNLPNNEVLIIGAKTLLNGLNQDYETIEIPYATNWQKYGQETKEAGEFSFQCLKKVCELAKNNKLKGIVTAPVSKNALNLAGHSFSGQTEILEKYLSNPVNDEIAEMVFVSNDFRVLLLTRHVALKDVKITKKILVEKVKRINRVLKINFNIETPKIALCSLNPHAGESGLLGNEEIKEFTPALQELRNIGINITNPLPADTLFVKAAKAFMENKQQPYDIYCACYHDQGLIPIKMLAMDNAVNMTAGLNILRTSPAHGTAYDIAGKNIADESSMICAIKALL